MTVRSGLLAASFLLSGLGATWMLVFGQGSDASAPFPGDTSARGVPIVASFGREGFQPGMFSSPRGIAIDDRGRIAVADKSGRIQVFSLEGRFQASWRLPERQLGTPTGLAWHPGRLPPPASSPKPQAPSPKPQAPSLKPSLAIPDTHYRRILHLDENGALVTTWGSGHEGFQDFHAVTDCLRLSTPVLGAAWAVVEYGDERHDRLLLLDEAGRLIKEFGGFGATLGRMKRPMGLTQDREGTIIIADAVNHRVQRLSIAGEWLAPWGGVGTQPGRLRYPYDVAVGPDDALYVVEFGNHRVSRFAPDGRFLDCAGGAGLLKAPWGLAVARDGRVFVTDTEHHRVVVFRFPPLPQP